MEYLTFTLLTDTRPELLLTLIKHIDHCECNILQNYMNTYGSELIANFLVTGHWNALAKLENYLGHIEKEFNIQILRQRTQTKIYSIQHLPYLASILAKDASGVLLEVCKFFFDLGIAIETIHAETYPSKKTNVPMCSIMMHINIPETLAIGELRERFTLLCDTYNLDGILEPDKI